MHNHTHINGSTRRTILAAAILSTFPLAKAICQVTPTAEPAIHWVDMGPTQAPDQQTKASCSTFATRRETNVSSANASDGYLTTMSDGTKVWAIGFKSEGAVNMSLEISDCHLPEGGELSVWGVDGRSESVDTSAGVSPIVDGEWIALQYTGPESHAPEIKVTAAYCGFRGIGTAWGDSDMDTGNKSTGQGSSQACEVSASCAPRADKISRSVCRLILNNTNLGTGTLINNTAGDRAPLVLTSAHVVAGNKLRSCTALFGFSEPFCDAADYYTQGTDQVDGAELVAFDAATDMALIRLKRAPSLASAPYWAGWERASEVQSDLICVHHPRGDAQKASAAASATPRTTYNTTDRNATGGSFKPNVFWNVGHWTEGTTEGGSSGSSLVNADGRVIGALSGGMATCKSPNDDWFWMLSEAWNASSDGYATLGEILDPTGSGATSAGGIDGVATTDGNTVLKASYDPRDGASAANVTLGGANTAIAQDVATGSSASKVWAVRLFAETEAEAARLASQAEVGICPAGEVEPSSFTTAADGVFSSNTSVDYVFESPTWISSASAIRVVVRLRDGSQGDAIKLMATETSDGGQEAILLRDGLWEKAGATLATNVIFTSGSDTADTAVPSKGSIAISCDDGVVTLTGEAISMAAVYDKGGRLMRLMDAGGRTELSIDMCGAATGLYIVRVLCVSGRQKSFKILNI